MNIIFRKLHFSVFALQVIRNEALLLLTHLTREAEVRPPGYISNCFFCCLELKQPLDLIDLTRC